MQLLGQFRFGQPGAFFEPRAVVAEIKAQPGPHLGGPLNGLGVAVEPVSPFLGLEVGHRTHKPVESVLIGRD